MSPFSSFVRRLSSVLVLFVGIVGVFLAVAPAAHARGTSLPGTLSVRSGISTIYFLEVAPRTARTPLNWSWSPSAAGGMLPPGLTLNAEASRLDYAAFISGTATTPGTYRVKVRAEYSLSEFHEGVYTFEVHAPSLVINPASIASVAVGAPFAKQLSLETASGIGLGATSWEVDRLSALPPGIELDRSTGRLSGTPTAAGTYSFRLYAASSSSGPSYAYRDYTLRVVPALALRFTSASPGAASVGSAYTYTFVTDGGTNPHVLRVTNAAQLPPGLTLSTVGTLSGTPTAAGTYTFTVKADDAVGASIAQEITMTVAGASTPLAITPGLPFLTGTARVSYPPQMVRATGGRAPYTWSIASGSFPPGLNMDGSEGIVSGTPTTAGTYTFQVRVDDGAGASAFATYTIAINPTSVTTPILPSFPTIPSLPIVTSPIIGAITFPTTPALTTRLDTLGALGIAVHALVKLPDDGNRATQADSAVYYIGADGRRHAFSNDKVYFTWYTSFGGVRTVSASALASIPLGANVTYKPGVKLVKFQTDARVYAVLGRQLRPLASETVAIALYGSAWNRQVDDISDAFYGDYQFGTDVRSTTDFSVEGARNAVATPSDALPAL